MSFLKGWLSEGAPDILPTVCKGHVDFIFVMFLCQSNLNDFVNYTNNKHPNIKVLLSSCKKVLFISFKESPLKIMKNLLFHVRSPFHF